MAFWITLNGYLHAVGSGIGVCQTKLMAVVPGAAGEVGVGWLVSSFPALGRGEGGPSVLMLPSPLLYVLPYQPPPSCFPPSFTLWCCVLVGM